MTDTAPLLTEEEVAARLNCSPKTVQRRKLPFVKMGRLKRYRPEVVEEYICKSAAKLPDEQPSSPELDAREGKPTGAREGRSRLKGREVQSAQDELKEALALISRPRGRGSRNARRGTTSMKTGSAIQNQ